MSSSIVKVYYCYAKEVKEDEDLRDRLTAHLTPLRRARKLTIWFDVQIQAGSYWKLEVEKQLQEADLILLLVSADFIQSDYCYNLQLTQALNHYEAGKVEIVPILLRPVLWEETLIKQLPLILPTSRLPIALWPNRDEAFVNIAAAIRDLIQSKLARKRSISPDEGSILDQLGESVLIMRCPQCGNQNRIGARFCTRDGVDLLASQMIIAPKPMPTQRTKEDWVKQGRLFAEQRFYADALAAYEQALLLDSHYATACFYKGQVLYLLQQYPAALAAYNQAIRYSQDSAAPYCHKGDTLRHLQDYEEALKAYDKAIQLGSPEIKAAAYNGKRRVYELHGLEKEAKEAFKHAVSLNPALLKE
jgi:tetratricopeptide (TPR) repeat protein